MYNGPISSWFWSHLEGSLSLDQTIVDDLVHCIYASALLGQFDARWQRAYYQGQIWQLPWVIWKSLSGSDICWTFHYCCHIDSFFPLMSEGTVMAPAVAMSAKAVPFLDSFQHYHRIYLSCHCYCVSSLVLHPGVDEWQKLWHKLVHEDDLTDVINAVTSTGKRSLS